MRTLKLELELVFFLGISSGLTLAKSFSLDWSPSPSPEVAGYTVYYGTTSEAYGMHLDAGTNISATVSGLPGGRIYFFAVSAYDPDGMESDPSNEISFSVPGVILPEQTNRTIAELTLLTVTNTARGDNASQHFDIQFSWSTRREH